MELYGDKLSLVGILHPRVKSLLQEIDFSLAVRNTVLITLVTSLLGIIAVTYWATNRQTQITKSRSQQKLQIVSHGKGQAVPPETTRQKMAYQPHRNTRTGPAANQLEPYQISKKQNQSKPANAAFIKRPGNLTVM